MNKNVSPKLALREKNEKRLNYLKWDEYFMAVTLLEVRKAAHKLITNAAIILNKRKIIISMASNSLSDENKIAKKPDYLCHAEYKALQNIQEGNVMYTTSFPCEKCAEKVVQTGISEVIYFRCDFINNRTEELFKESGVICRQFISDKGKINIDFSQMCDHLPLTPP